MLRKLYQHIEFELPPKEITGSDLTKLMFERGDFAVVYKFECVWQGEVKTNFASGRKQATYNAVEKLFKVVECE